MFFLKNISATVLLSLPNITFATPAQDQTVDDFFKVSDIKTVTLNTLQDNDLANLGLNKETFWQFLEPEFKKIDSSNLSEEELRTSIQYYKNPEVQSLLKYALDKASNNK